MPAARGPPRPGGGLTSAWATHLTPYGEARVAWTLENNTFTLNVTVPPNTTATVTLPGQEHAPLEVTAGEHHWSYGYQPPRQPLPPLSLDLPLIDVWDDEEATRELLALAQAHPPLAGMLKPGSGVSKLPLDLVLSFSVESKALVPEVAALFDRLNEERAAHT
ncbi:alpha-L-rhamnosidase C-terminal domain-containing protein [Deinococcus malanensis]|uniref:alpha-L-rhamnosidase C-terminal domain-containing protein n=1 Tax=Deinococcus malanensis TaxID=1706855 RepID=UPI00362CE195